MMQRVEAWFHMLLLAFVVGTIIYVTAFGAPARCSSRSLHQNSVPGSISGVLIFIEDFGRQASSLHRNGL